MGKSALRQNAPRALLLDLDGTLADSLDITRRVYEHFLREHGAVPSASEFESLNGPPLSEVVRRLRAAHGLVGEESQLLTHYENLLDQTYVEVDPNPGARRLLRRARQAGCATGVVTSNSFARTRDWLRRTALDRQIDVLVTAVDVRLGKPDPEPYNVALARIGASPDEAVAVEDSAQGARAALGAGVRTFLLRSIHLPIDSLHNVEVAVSLDAVAAQLWP